MDVAHGLHELKAKLSEAGYSLTKLDQRSGTYVAKGENANGDKVERNGDTAEMAVANLVRFVIRRNSMQPYSKTASWGTDWLGKHEDIAKDYRKLPVFDEKAVPAYKALAEESKHQADEIRRQVHVEVVNTAHPYKSAKEMREDVHQNRHLSVSDQNLEHPIWSPEEVMDFRIVHDVLGHAQGGGEFSWRGQNIATSAHMPHVSPLARQALFTQTIGQASEYKAHGMFGPQRAGILQHWVEPANAANGEHVEVPNMSTPRTAMEGIDDTSRLGVGDLVTADGGNVRGVLRIVGLTTLTAYQNGGEMSYPAARVVHDMTPEEIAEYGEPTPQTVPLHALSLVPTTPDALPDHWTSVHGSIEESDKVRKLKNKLRDGVSAARVAKYALQIGATKAQLKKVVKEKTDDYREKALKEYDKLKKGGASAWTRLRASGVMSVFEQPIPEDWPKPKTTAPDEWTEIADDAPLPRHPGRRDRVAAEGWQDGYQTHERGHLYRDEEHHKLVQLVHHSIGDQRTADAAVDTKKESILKQLAPQKWWNAQYDPRGIEVGDAVKAKQPMWVNVPETARRTLHSLAEQQSGGKTFYEAPRNNWAYQRPNYKGTPEFDREHNPTLYQVQGGSTWSRTEEGFVPTSDVYLQIPTEDNGGTGKGESNATIKVPPHLFAKLGIEAQGVNESKPEIVQRANPVPPETPSNLDRFKTILDSIEDPRAAQLYRWMAREFREGKLSAYDIDDIDHALPYVEWQRKYGNKDFNDSLLDFNSESTNVAQLRSWVSNLEDMGLDPETNTIQWESDPIYTKGGLSIAPLDLEDFERHGEIMDQCISDTESQPYGAMQEAGHWQHYVVRDKTGRPHATICMAQSNGSRPGSEWTIIENRGAANTGLHPEAASTREGKNGKYAAFIDDWLGAAQEKGGISVNRYDENDQYAPQHPTQGLAAHGYDPEQDSFSYGLQERSRPEDWEHEPRDHHDRAGDIEPQDLQDLDDYINTLENSPYDFARGEAEPDYDYEVNYYDPANTISLHRDQLQTMVEELVDLPPDERDIDSVQGWVTKIQTIMTHRVQTTGYDWNDRTKENVASDLRKLAEHVIQYSRQTPTGGPYAHPHHDVMDEWTEDEHWEALQDPEHDQDRTAWAQKVADMFEVAARTPIDKSLPSEHNDGSSQFSLADHHNKTWTPMEDQPWDQLHPMLRDPMHPNPMNSRPERANPQNFPNQTQIHPIFEGDRSQAPNPGSRFHPDGQPMGVQPNMQRYDEMNNVREQPTQIEYDAEGNIVYDEYGRPKRKPAPMIGWTAKVSDWVEVDGLAEVSA